MVVHSKPDGVRKGCRNALPANFSPPFGADNGLACHANVTVSSDFTSIRSGPSAAIAVPDKAAAISHP